MGEPALIRHVVLHSEQLGLARTHRRLTERTLHQQLREVDLIASRQELSPAQAKLGTAGKSTCAWPGIWISGLFPYALPARFQLTLNQDTPGHRSEQAFPGGGPCFDCHLCAEVRSAV